MRVISSIFSKPKGVNSTETLKNEKLVPLTTTPATNEFATPVFFN